MSPFVNKRTKVHRFINFVLLIEITLLGGCSSVTGISTSTIETPTETAITNSVELLVTFTPSPTAAFPITATMLPSPENILKFQPFEITSESPLDAKPVGALVIWSDPVQLVRFDPQVKLETILGIDFEVSCPSTSPDGKWFAYCQSSDESPTGKWLIVESANGQQQKRVPMDRHLIYFDAYLWLDDQHLIFPLIKNPEKHRPEAYPMVVVNPFTGEQIELSSDYPGLQLSVAGPTSRMDFGYSDVVYDPSLDLVIFPSWGGEHNYIVLWDRQSNSLLAKVEDQSQGFGHYPLWSPDAKQFAVPVVHSIESENIVEEWFRVSRDGQVEQLTQFGKYFVSSEIGSASNWSPDGQKLAFWLNVSPSLCPGLNLAILDITTKQVMDTCIQGRSDYIPPPIWSLDSQYIVVVNANTSPLQTILVDLEQGRAFDITKVTDGSRPIGWLVSP